MFCAFCKHFETIVKDSRISEDGTFTRRRRECPSCNARFTTYERVQLKEIIIVKKSGEKEFFNRDKLRNSIKTALRKRNITAEIIDEMLDEIYLKLNKISDAEISSKKIGEIVMRKLRKLDKVAFIRFASVYKNFETTRDFQEFLQKHD